MHNNGKIYSHYIYYKHLFSFSLSNTNFVVIYLLNWTSVLDRIFLYIIQQTIIFAINYLIHTLLK